VQGIAKYTVDCVFGGCVEIKLIQAKGCPGPIKVGVYAVRHYRVPVEVRDSMPRKVVDKLIAHNLLVGLVL
jgi:hypothetical protein